MQHYKNLAAVLGISLCGISLYLIRKYWKRDEDEFNEDTVMKTSNHTQLEIKVPKNLVGEIIGREGSNIKRISEMSGARINFRDFLDERFCCISGSVEAVHIAQRLIQEFIENQPVLEHCEVLIPRGVTGKIIGRCGESLTEMKSRSGAKITITQEAGDSTVSKVTFKGTRAQILEAKSLLNEKLQKCKEVDTRLQLALSKREPRAPPKSMSNNEFVDNLARGTARNERLSPVVGTSDLPFEVYVSAMTDPSKFWIQIVGPKATELDQLVEEMTEFYNIESNRENHSPNKVSKGDLVAAIFKYDNKWYRAEVLNVDEVKEEAELYYVDYGDTDFVTFKNISELRTDFLRLHFQAIECYLDNIDPVDGQWSEEAVDKFEDWTYVAQWKKLSAKIKGYSNREKKRATGREGSPVPGIDLYDYSGEKDVNIAEELVNQGYANFKTQSSARTSRAASVSSNVSS